jgi:predicted  nucleic acid-binding Zn-ribbon protein
VGSYHLVSASEGNVAETAGSPTPGAAAAVRGMNRLLELQELDVAIDRLHARLGQLQTGDEVRAARERARDAEGRLGQLRLETDEVVRQQGRLESDVDSMGQKVEAERRRLYDGSVASPKELQSIEHEVENLRGRKSAKEDELLDRMQRREDLEASVALLEAEVAQVREGLRQIEETTGREQVDIERELEARAAERASLLPEFDPDLLELYEALRPQKRGVAAAALVDGVCHGCNQKLSAVYLDRLKRGDGVRRCEYCRRILVLA